MRVYYVGASEKTIWQGREHRGAELAYEAQELPFAEAVASLMETEGWNIMLDYEWGFCELESREEFDDFMTDWKAAKKTARKSLKVRQ